IGRNFSRGRNCAGTDSHGPGVRNVSDRGRRGVELQPDRRESHGSSGADSTPTGRRLKARASFGSPRGETMNRFTNRVLGIILAFILSWMEPLAAFAQQPTDASQQQPAGNSQPAPNAQQNAPGNTTPDSRNTAPTREEQENKATQEQINGQRLPESPSSVRNNPTEQPSTATQAPSQAAPIEPTGTAAAQTGRISGNAASRPAGAAIAPAKQHQARSLLIKLGVIAGAGVALGTVYGLSRASGPKPPGAK